MTTKTFDVQLLDRVRGKFWTWEHGMEYEAAKAQAAHAREQGEVTRIVKHDDSLTLQDLL